MEQFKKHKHIIVDMNSEESISSALERYKDILESGQVLNDENVFDIEFVKEENGRIKPLDIKDSSSPEILKDIMEMSERGVISEDRIIEFGDQIYLSEAIFFSNACTYKNLKEKILEVAKLVVDYAKKENDTWALWVDDYSVFGIDMLYCIGKNYPEYTYLIGRYIISCWDNEHASYVSYEYLPRLAKERGVTRDLIKAFVYCDNLLARDKIFGEGFLKDYFKENVDDYDYFKIELVERFKKEPPILNEDESIEEFIESYYWSIGGFDYDEYFWDKSYIYDSFQNEAADLYEQIKPHLEKYAEEIDEKDEYYEEEDHDDEVEDDDYQVFYEFFTKALENGDKVWDYIMEGKNTEALHEIKPGDIKEIAKKKGLKIESLGGVHNILKSFINEFYDEDETGREKVARAIDVFFRLQNKKSFGIPVDSLIIENNIISLEEYMERYELSEISPVELMKGKLFSYKWMDVYGVQLKTLHKIYQNSPDEIIEIFKNKSKFNEMDILAVTYIYAKEWMSNKNENLKYLADLIDKFFIYSLVKAFKDYSEFHDDDIREIKKYLHGLKTKDETLQLLKEKLVVQERNDRISALQPDYEVFRCSDELKKIALTAFIGAKWLPIEMADKMKGAFEIMVELSPVKTINYVSCLYRKYESSSFQNLMEYNDMIHTIDGFGLTLYRIAWELDYTFHNKHMDKDLAKIYEGCLEKLAGDVDAQGPSMLGTEVKQECEYIKESIKYLDDTTRSDIYVDFSEKYEDRDTSELQMEIFMDHYKDIILNSLIDFDKSVTSLFKRDDELVFFEDKEYSLCDNHSDEFRKIITGLHVEHISMDKRPKEEDYNGIVRVYLQEKEEGTYEILRGEEYVFMAQSEDENHYYNGQISLAILSKDVSKEKIHKYFPKNAKEARKNRIWDKFEKYILGELDYEHIEELVKKEFDYYIKSGIEEHVWKISHEKVTYRLLKLYIEFGYRESGYDGIVYDLFNKYKNENRGLNEFVQLMKEIGISYQFIIEFLIMEGSKIKLGDAPKGEFGQCLKKYVEDGLDVFKYLEKSSDDYKIYAINLAGYDERYIDSVLKYEKDNSRKVRDAVKKALAYKR
ncbi:hypothetical protein [Oceanirhabdus sp. W0125-5]|uniref:hypothetical protein n=1 Tax=Oceanirhabdus sp. W0125-5 TaxID=2999116 RepID=UPI0022F30F58|nr:hypothetical protein [Oceanirhabdus sp. W0125-5]WBW96275.1 hypothetical protein OW730_21660 [Oceanirhabdus sp. W0125-5]